jgi:hypothetical protein
VQQASLQYWQLLASQTLNFMFLLSSVCHTAVSHVHWNAEAVCDVSVPTEVWFRSSQLRNTVNLGYNGSPPPPPFPAISLGGIIVTTAITPVGLAHIGYSGASDFSDVPPAVDFTRLYNFWQHKRQLTTGTVCSSTHVAPVRAT